MAFEITNNSDGCSRGAYRLQIRPSDFLRLDSNYGAGSKCLGAQLAESSQLMYKGLGLPERDKEYYVYESGHYVLRDEYIKRFLAWLDKYIGPVE